MLPNQIDGLSILTTLRGVGIKTPVIVLSALTALDERVRGLKSGGDDFPPTPFALLELPTPAEALVRRSLSTATHRVLPAAVPRLDFHSSPPHLPAHPPPLQHPTPP